MCMLILVCAMFKIYFCCVNALILIVDSYLHNSSYNSLYIYHVDSRRQLKQLLIKFCKESYSSDFLGLPLHTDVQYTNLYTAISSSDCFYIPRFQSVTYGLKPIPASTHRIT